MRTVNAIDLLHFQVLIFIGETGLCFNWAIVTDILLVNLLSVHDRLGLLEKSSVWRPCLLRSFDNFVVHGRTDQTIVSRGSSNPCVSLAR